MKNFAQLFSDLDQTNKTKKKVALLKNYFANASDKDKVWTIALFTGRKPPKPVNTALLRSWTLELAGIPNWLFDESYYVVGDLAETIANLLPRIEQSQDKPLYEWIQFIIDLTKLSEQEKKEKVSAAWQQLSTQESFVFNKLITGSFRIGVSQSLIVKAISELTSLEAPLISHKIMGNWDPQTSSFHSLILNEDEDENISRPYPFFLAYALEEDPVKLGTPEEWIAEWKWDGIRAQIIKRKDEIFIWSRGEELVTEKFPELSQLAADIPNGTAIDGEILPFQADKPLPFSVLQTRIGRKNLTSKILMNAPVVLVAYDIMEWEGKDIRETPLNERKRILENCIQKVNKSTLRLSNEVQFETWKELSTLRESSRDHLAEGFVLKRTNSPYQVGRKRGDWWKWKIDPFSVDGVLIYAQKGHGKRADLYTDYTFGVWDGETLVPFAKAYSGLTDQEIKQVDSFIRKNIKEKFGPVRTVNPELVFEIAFEGIQKSTRHKCGIAVRFPRILRWRKDKNASEADSIDTLKKLLIISGEQN